MTPDDFVYRIPAGYTLVSQILSLSLPIGTGTVLRADPSRLYLAVSPSGGATIRVAFSSDVSVGLTRGFILNTDPFIRKFQDCGPIVQQQLYYNHAAFGAVNVIVETLRYVSSRRVNGSEIEGLASASLGHDGRNTTRWRELKAKIADYQRLRSDSVHSLNRPATGFNARHSGSYRWRAT